MEAKLDAILRKIDLDYDAGRHTDNRYVTERQS